MTTARLIELCKEAGLNEKQIQAILDKRPPNWKDYSEDEIRYRCARAKALYGERVTRKVKKFN